MASPRVDGLLDAAEAEFATEGIETGSLRRIMREAGADPGAVHYHFGGREALAAAVLERLLVPLNARRLELLAEVVAGGQPPPARLVEALVRPDVEAALPSLPFAALAWRIRWCVFGTVGTLLADETAPCERPADDLVGDLARTLAA